jgi:hypothetical protein
VIGLDWQDADPGAYDPDNPLALLEKAAAAGESDRATRTVWAVRCMAAGGAPPFILNVVARDYVKRAKLIGLAPYDDLVRRELVDRAGGHDSGEHGPSVATQLVQIAQELYTFGVSDLGEPFALPLAGPKIVAMLRGSKTSLRALLAREFFSRTGRAATQQALADALLVIEGLAQDADESRLYLRAAQHEGALWLDLADHTGRAVRITGQGWSIEDQPPVLFKRTSLTSPLPEPQRGGKLADLWTWLNVSKDDRPLVAAAMVAALFSEEPHVVLAIFGEQGTGKTTAVKVIVLLLDPSPAPTRKPPRDADSWVTAASGSWVVGIDNLSDIPAWLSDSLCRAVTGDGDVRRKLYTDADFAVFSFRRCIVFDSIDVGALAADLADRTVAITLDLIPDEDRRDEETFWAEWADAHPKLLGAVLDLASAVMARLPTVELKKKPRMADYARILAAVDAELGTKALQRYADRAAVLAAESLESEPFAAAVLRSMASPFEGYSAELLDLITPGEPDWKPPKEWPAKPGEVTGLMKRLAPTFRKVGWQVENLGTSNHRKLVRWKITPPEDTRKGASEPRTPPQPPHGAGSAGSGGGSALPFSSTRQERSCSLCGERPPGTGGVLCPECKESPGKKATT